MTLLSAGYWHTTYWAENYWNPSYWLQYGYVAPPPTTPPAILAKGGFAAKKKIGLTLSLTMDGQLLINIPMKQEA